MGFKNLGKTSIINHIPNKIWTIIFWKFFLDGSICQGENGCRSELFASIKKFVLQM